MSCTLTVRHFTFCLQSVVFYYICILAKLRCSISPSVCQLLAVLMRKKLGLKCFLADRKHPGNLLLVFYWPPVCISSWVTDWQPKLRPLTELRKLASECLTGILCFLVYCCCWIALFVLRWYFISSLSVYSNDFSRMVAEEYLSFFNFTGLGLDQALRWESTAQ